MAKSKGFLAVVAATVGGFVAGVLLAPKSGKETRDDLKAKADAKKELAEKKYADASLVAKKGKAEAEAFAKHTAGHATEVAKDVRAHAGEVVADAKERSARLAEDAKKTFLK